MSIIFDPRKMLEEIAPESKIKRMVSRRLDLKRASLTFVDRIPFLDKKQVTDVALKTVKSYKERVDLRAQKEDRDSGRDLEKDLSKNPALLINRVQNNVVFQVHEMIKDKYAGQRARWLPSDADEPRPEHQANYGKEYIIGEGIDGVEPGDEPGCKCGVEILVNETELDLG